ncbi:GAF domain-containing protein [Marilutibacter maris]|uniref:Adenylate/guanylate cyclase n=1 Tax=Marilutibacter maris TaxID=1605891 RepID=A0A2U9T5R7_9GAMM|nr:GAF domain-containing protein [Lysobacter maris]AWV06735.1 adenylate/guanylate cyclase [Lysobacter maris]KAB8198581.1 GAF domain-containing protein [Lysobacter maris]
MQARLIAYPPEGAATICLIQADGMLRLGRTPDSGLATAPAGSVHLVLDHPSVSRVHAELRGMPDGWRLIDMGSKNGSFVDGVQCTDAPLPPTCWLRFGDVHCEFATIDDTEASDRRQQVTARRALATAHTAQLQRMTGLGDLLDASLRAVLELAHCERGFVLLDNGNDYVVRTSLALDPTMLASRAFSGSVSAVRRALAERRTIVANDVARLSWLAERASVAIAGLNTLVCVPLFDGSRVLGAIYADRVRPGPAINDLDVDLLAAFADNAAMWIAAQRTRELLDAHASATAIEGGANGLPWDGIVAAHTGTAG